AGGLPKADPIRAVNPVARKGDLHDCRDLLPSGTEVSPLAMRFPDLRCSKPSRSLFPSSHLFDRLFQSHHGFRIAPDCGMFPAPLIGLVTQVSASTIKQATM